MRKNEERVCKITLLANATMGVGICDNKFGLFLGETHVYKGKVYERYTFGDRFVWAENRAKTVRGYMCEKTAYVMFEDRQYLIDIMTHAEEPQLEGMIVSDDGSAPWVIVIGGIPYIKAQRGNEMVMVRSPAVRLVKGLPALIWNTSRTDAEISAMEYQEASIAMIADSIGRGRHTRLDLEPHKNSYQGDRDILTHLLVKNTDDSTVIRSFSLSSEHDQSDFSKEDALAVVLHETGDDVASVRSGNTIVIGHFTVIARTSAVADEFEKAFSKPLSCETCIKPHSIPLRDDVADLYKFGHVVFKPPLPDPVVIDPSFSAEHFM